jgi:hypothetical protein
MTPVRIPIVSSDVDKISEENFAGGILHSNDANILGGF